jgi:hypothetical protein
MVKKEAIHQKNQGFEGNAELHARVYGRGT